MQKKNRKSVKKAQSRTCHTSLSASPVNLHFFKVEKKNSGTTNRQQDAMHFLLFRFEPDIFLSKKLSENPDSLFVTDATTDIPIQKRWNSCKTGMPDSGNNRSQPPTRNCNDATEFNPNTTLAESAWMLISAVSVQFRLTSYDRLVFL